MKTTGLLRLLSLGLLLVASGLAPAQTGNTASELIVGKWVPASGKEKGTFVEFTKDGEMTYTFGTKEDMTYKGKYKVLSEKMVEVEWTEETLKKNNLLSKKPKKVQLAVTKEQLTFDPALVNIKKKWMREK